MSRFRSRRGVVIESVVWLALILVGLAALVPLQSILDGKLSEKAFEDLQTVILTVGGAMIGATAIVSSFVLFALQVNVERLPYGLFRRFSSDAQLIGSFAVAFGAAIAVTAISLIQDITSAAAAVLLAIAGVSVVLRLLLHAFKRSLRLIDPLEQLLLVRSLASEQMRTFSRRVAWMLPLMQETERPDKGDQKGDRGKEPQLDEPRARMLSSSPGWDRVLREAINHAAAYVRKAGEQGDIEVSAAALATLVALNRLYIHTKGKTFYASVPLFHDPRVTDGFINYTLERVRRLREAAIARRDEAQTEQLFQTFLALLQAYFGIEYPGITSSKFHASLAGRYLEDSVEAAARAGLTDTTMAGLAKLGEAAEVFLVGGHPSEMSSFAQKIGFIGASVVTQTNDRPITLSAVEQLAKLTLVLIRIRTTDIRFVAGQIRQSVHLIARLLLEVRDAPLGSVHSSFLAPYFSPTSFTSLRAQLTPLVNALLNADAEDENARTVAYNISEWSDDLHRDLKDLLLAAVEKQSHFTFDIVHWITDISELLVCVARAPATAGPIREKLEDNAETLFLVLSWIPHEPNTARWLEAYSLTDSVFDYALKSQSRGFQIGFERAWKFLLQWAVQAGREETGWGTLDHGLSALVALALGTPENRADALKAQLELALAEPNGPAQEVRDTSAQRLRAKAEHLQARQFETRRVERILAGNEPQATRTLLREIADILSPNAANEPAAPAQ